MTQPFIHLNNVEKTFKQNQTTQTVLENIDLDITEGQFVCLLGPSGCGKSTILNLLAGFEQSTQGHIYVDGQRIVAPNIDRAVVFQQAQLFPWLSVKENIEFPLKQSKATAQYIADQTEYYLEKTGLKKFENHRIWQISGGMKQRVALARAWVMKPKILLMDEPFGALDAQTRILMQETLTQLWQDNKTTILFVTHDIDESLLLADRIILMAGHPGRIIDDIQNNLPRPRSIENIAQQQEFIESKKHILEIMRKEVTRMIDYLH
ncbi:ABC transporter ATP-binding protein [Acinetobacter rudis]|uniref:NitT/TauT family transport system ATP-binding protein n=1 Tax=Acinetobacter rudis CIP 110305 TaxID=421052 RepID=S3P763_9GAMM|nr:ABC transporter ATP-binding protein [Acinetobacter rudis]EPF74696.1 NitT/TauT family transport system ATP-binding protein [Acinetobacter rudis CIP 110305]